MDNISKKHRRSIRLKEYDYSQGGAYFITICAYKRQLLFRDFVFRKIIKEEWLRTAFVRREIKPDKFVVMPNHFHGILWIVENDVGATRRVAQRRARHRLAPTLTANSLGAIIGQFKSIATKRINIIRKAPGAPVWQRNYYEHIIRNRSKLFQIQKYIIGNPSRWRFDREKPARIQDGAYDNQWRELEEMIYGGKRKV